MVSGVMLVMKFNCIKKEIFVSVHSFSRGNVGIAAIGEETLATMLNEAGEVIRNVFLESEAVAEVHKS